MLLTCHETVDLRQRDAPVVDVTVFEKAPELQAGHQREVVQGTQKTESAVEPVDRPQLRVVSPHHELHLWRGDAALGEVCCWKRGPPRVPGRGTRLFWDGSTPPVCAHRHAPSQGCQPAGPRCLGPCLTGAEITLRAKRGKHWFKCADSLCKRCTSGQPCLTKQRDERFVSIQVLCHHLLKHNALKDMAVDGDKSSLREMHSHHRILVRKRRYEQVK